MKDTGRRRKRRAEGLCGLSIWEVERGRVLCPLLSGSLRFIPYYLLLSFIFLIKWKKEIAIGSLLEMWILGPVSDILNENQEGRIIPDLMSLSNVFENHGVSRICCGLLVEYLRTQLSFLGECLKTSTLGTGEMTQSLGTLARAHKFCSKHPHRSSLPPVNTVPGDPVPSSGF